MDSIESVVYLGGFFVELRSGNVTVRRTQLVDVAVSDRELIWRDKGFAKKEKHGLVKIYRCSVHVVLWWCQRLRRLRLLADGLKGCPGPLVRPWQNKKKEESRRLLLQWKRTHLLDDKWLLTNVCAFGLAKGCRPKDLCRRRLRDSRNPGGLRGQYADGTVQSVLEAEFIQDLPLYGAEKWRVWKRC